MNGMPMKKLSTIVVSVFLALALTGCQTNPEKQLLATQQSQVQLRSYQTKAFDTNDKQQVLRAVIATLQDLEFVLDNADLILGTVSGTKFGKASYQIYELKMTVTVRPRGESQMMVRANAQYQLQAVEDPQPYQDFFTALEKSLFLSAQNVD